MAKDEQEVTFSERPDKFGADVTIADRDDANAALREVGWLNARQAVLKAEFETKLAALQAEYEAATKLQIDQQEMSITARREQLEGQLLDWADAHRGELLTGDKKSVELEFGTLAWREAKDSVDYLEGWSQKKAVEKAGAAEVTKDQTLITALEDLVAKEDWHGVIEVKLQVNKTNSVKAFQTKRVDRERLKSIGLKFVRGEEYVSVEAAEFVR